MKKYFSKLEYYGGTCCPSLCECVYIMYCILPPIAYCLCRKVVALEIVMILNAYVACLNATEAWTHHVISVSVLSCAQVSSLLLCCFWINLFCIIL